MKKLVKLREKIEHKNMREAVEDMARRFSSQVAFRYRKNPHDKETVAVTYQQLRDDVLALGTELLSMGLHGKHCAVIGKNSYNWVRTYFALLSIGAVMVPLDRDWGAEELADTVKKADTAIIIADCDIDEKIKKVSELSGTDRLVSLDGEGDDSIAGLVEAGKIKAQGGDSSYFDVEIDPTVMSLLVFTSGTTGKGKGVMLSQRNILSDLADIIPYIDFSRKCMNVLPPHHTYGSSVTIYGQASIGCEIYISSGIRYVPKELKEFAPGHIVVVPLYVETFYRKVLAGIRDSGKEGLVRKMMKLSNALRKIGIDLRKKFFGKILASFGGELNMIITGGAPINQEIIDTFDAIGVTVLNGYGITECAPLISVNHNNYIVNGSVGPVIDIDEVKIDEPNEDGEGEILVKGPNVMLGYYKDEETTAAAFDEDGFFRTGDYGKLGENRVITITGRKKNLIILSNGKNVYPEEIENEFSSVPGVLEIIVYEGQSKRGLEHNKIVAEIYPDKDYLEKNGITDAYAHLKPYIDKYNRTAVPYKKIDILKVREEEFPKNTLRKILRFKMDMTID